MMNAVERSRWQAVVNRDRSQTFIFAVRTTRVACRPGCASRTPKESNVRFFDDFAAAQAAGYRACKRCAPDDVAADAELRRIVERACSAFAAEPSVTVAQVAAAAGLSRFHFARRFRALTGLTPARYRRACRESRLREALAHGATVADAAERAGYASPGGAYASTPPGLSPGRMRAGAPGERIVYAVGRSSLGSVIAAQSATGICAIELGDDDAAAFAVLRRDFPRAELIADDRGLTAQLRAIIDVVDGRDDDPALDLDIRGTAFRRRVWDALRAIAPGAQRTYGDIAALLGRPGAARAVAAACAANPLAVVIPCHRAVAAGGRAAGYRWGSARKRALLAREGRDAEC